MLSNPADWKQTRAELKAKRDSLFTKYVKHPDRTHLALEIKIIDDQVAECVEQQSLEIAKRSSHR
jgi:hypothetical protein